MVIIRSILVPVFIMAISGFVVCPWLFCCVPLQLLNVMEKLMEKTPWLYKALKATGLTHMVYSYFDEPELLDDLK